MRSASLSKLRLAPMVFSGQPGMFESLPEPFETLQKLQAIACPVLVMHGDKDPERKKLWKSHEIM